MSIIDRIIAAMAREAEAAQQARTDAQPSVAWPTADERRAEATLGRPADGHLSDGTAYWVGVPAARMNDRDTTGGTR